MGLKKLKSDILEEIDLEIKKNEGLLCVQNESLAWVCIHIDNNSFTKYSEKDFAILKDLSKVMSFKYIGSEDIFKTIHPIIDTWNVSDKKIRTVDKEQLIKYFPRNGNIKILKNEADLLPVEVTKKRVLIIDDSETIQKLLRKIISSSQKLEVVDVASTPSQAIEFLKKHPCDIITLDVHLPEMNGVELYKNFIKNLNIPTVMISSVSINEGPLIIEALALGAITYIQKPSFNELQSITPLIIEKLECIEAPRKKINPVVTSFKHSLQFSKRNGMIVIGSSTGGTVALEEILTKLPKEIPPILVVQHIPAFFSKALAERLNKLCAFNVKEATAGEIVSPNTVYIAPGGFQMTIADSNGSYMIKISEDESDNLYKPCVDNLFLSVAKLKTKKVVGAILTGMGKDGAMGLLELRKIGAKTFVQDEESCVVFGMPKEALRIDAATKSVTLQSIASELEKLYNEL